MDQTHEVNGLIIRLGLSEFYPSKISMQQLPCSGSLLESKQSTCTPMDLPWILISKIMKQDFRWRDSFIPNMQLQHVDVSTNCKTKTQSVFDLNTFLESKSEESSSPTIIHPVDVLIATLSCCSIDLKLTLYQKLFLCKQSVPLVHKMLDSQTLCFALLPLRALSLDFRIKENSVSVSAANVLAKVIGFIKIGMSRFSKSRLINALLSEQDHPVFCYHDKLPVQTSALDLRGLIEVAWFLPSGNDKNFNDVIAFCNLRGNSSCHLKELTVLTKLANVIIAVVNVDCLMDERAITVLKHLRQFRIQTALLLTANSLPVAMDKVRRDLKLCLENAGTANWNKISVLTTFESNMEKTTASIRTEIRQLITPLIQKWDGRPFRTVAYELQELELVELDEQRYMNGMTLSKEVFSKLCNPDELKDEHGKIKDMPNIQNETLHFPLQDKMWKKWSDLNKRKSKVGKRLENHEIWRLEDKMMKIRLEQRNQKRPPAVEEFINCLLSCSNNHGKVQSFVMWLKIFLNDNARKVLPQLQKELQQREINMSSATSEVLQRNAESVEKELRNAALGLENFIRELGQIYESSMTSDDKVKKDESKRINLLPKVVAELLVNGQAIEIMDGYTATVPILWVKALMENTEKLLKGKTIFIVSVLGLQSSGKSTLLNALFGLQFSVSAGKCTKGVFIQLVPVKAKSDLPYDFLLVIDSEGLRAPELGQIKLDHDNELATFIIGMGDVTLVNIKGENTAEVRDTLQIVVQAFLRMKLANKRMDLQRKCILIHQNIGAVDAEEQMTQGLKKLQENLDEMTKKAAEEENISDITAFNQVIEFQGKKHVVYFPDLWLGDPPMAPCNPGYSNAAGVVLQILQLSAKEKNTFTTFPKLLLRIEDLWNGILSDNFVFSFKNTLEILAYNTMDTEYHKLTGQFDIALMEWFETCEWTCMEVCNSNEELDDCCERLISKIHEDLEEQQTDIEKALEKYFDNDANCDILSQWKSSRLLKFRNDAYTMILNTKQELRRMAEKKKLEILAKIKEVKLKVQLNQKATELALNMRNQSEPSDLDKTFSDMWNQWENQLVENDSISLRQVHEPLQKIIFERLGQCEIYVAKYLKEFRGQSPGKMTPLKLNRLEGSWKTSDIKLNFFLSFKRSLTEEKNVLNTDEILDQAISYTDNIFRKIDIEFRNLSEKDIPFQDHMAKMIVDKAITAFNDENRDKSHKFTFRPPYQAKLIVHICRYATQKFEDMNFQYEMRHGIKAKLKTYKNTAKVLFENTFNNKVAEIVASDLFCSCLENVILKSVKKALPNGVTAEILKRFDFKRYPLMIKVMTDLAENENENFESFCSYIKDPYSYIYSWMEMFIKKEIFKSTDGSTFYMDYVKTKVQDFIECVEKSVYEASSSDTLKSDIKTWAKIFRERVISKLAISDDQLKPVTDLKVAKINIFQDNVLKKLNSVQTKVTDNFLNHNIDTFTWEGNISPCEEVMKRIWGCPEKCPFCNEPCQLSEEHTSDKMDHKCIQHRPQGVNGRRLYPTRELVMNTCNYDVQQRKAKFHCSACNFKCRDSSKCTLTGDETTEHLYIEYKEYFPGWDITPCTSSESSKYWIWFMAKYKQQLAEKYNAKLLGIPKSWEKITKENAIHSLSELRW